MLVKKLVVLLGSLAEKLAVGAVEQIRDQAVYISLVDPLERKKKIILDYKWRFL